MRRALLMSVLTAACNHEPAPAQPVRCDAAIVVLRHERRCDDIRSGLSGFDVFEVASGPHRHASVTLPYGDTTPFADPGAWSVARVVFAPTEQVAGWPNHCLQFGSGRATYAGYVDGPIIVAASEAEARAKRGAGCSE